MNDMYNNQWNTLGVGNPIPPKKACLTGADFDDEKNNGSGDLFPPLGVSPTAYWPQEWVNMREKGLKQQEEKKDFEMFEERPMIVFAK